MHVSTVLVNKAGYNKVLLCLLHYVSSQVANSLTFMQFITTITIDAHYVKTCVYANFIPKHLYFPLIIITANNNDLQ